MRKYIGLLSLVLFSSCHFFNEEEKASPVYIVAEQSPIFMTDKCKDIQNFRERKKCADKTLMMQLYANAKYGGDSSQINHGSKMLVEFVITEKGTVESTSIVRSIESTLDKSISDYIQSSIWQPAQFEGNPVKFKKTLPIQFEFE